MGNNIIADKTFAFAIRIIKLYKWMCSEKREFVLSKQIVRSGTSVGANVSEALQGQSKRDFLMKMNIALKEASETKYWLRLLKETDYITEKQHLSILKDCIEIEKLLTSIVRTTSNSIK